MPSQTRDYRLAAALFVAGVVPAALLLDGALAAVRGWRPYGTIEHAVLGVAVLGLAVVAGCAAFRPTRRALQVRWAELALLCASAVAAWLVTELALAKVRETIFVEGLFHTRGPSIGRVFEPAPGVMPGIQGAARYTTDVMGVRTPGVPRQGYGYHVLCIGGSTTECTYLDDAATWPALLMRYANDVSGEPRIWVGNVGFSGFATTDHLRFLRTSKLVKHFDCFVIQPGINDLYPVLAGEDVEIHVNRNRPPEGRRPLWARSNFIQFYHDLRRTVPVGAGIEDRDGADYDTRRQKRRAAPIRDVPPDLDAALGAYKDRLRAIIEACRERSLTVVFTTQPVLWAEGLSEDAQAWCWFGWLADGPYLSIPALRHAMDRYNEALLTVCQEAGVPCVDLSSMNGREALFYDDCHFNEAGAREVARLLADWFLAHPSVP